MEQTAPQSESPDASAVTDAPRNDLPNELIEQIFSRIGEVSTLPTTAHLIISLADNPSSNADDLLDAVRNDPALAMRLMRTVNSSAFGLSNSISDLKQAITLIGFDEIRNLALTAYVSPLFTESSGHENYTRHGLWSHMVATGLIARQVAETCGKVPSQEAYLAGLLHDVGYILMDQYLHDPFCRIIDALDGSAPVLATEQRLLGFDHAMLGGFVAERWHVPPSQVAAIRYHHSPQECEGEHHLLACTVAVANFFCHLRDITSLGIRDMAAPPTEIFTDLGLTRRQVAETVAQLDQLLQAAAEMAIVQIR
ncbi:MAG: HDOD domain-containing protein [Pirellulales bacterium]|nr:HDOD domain-containing protein [Pirellulales bacterium]